MSSGLDELEKLKYTTYLEERKLLIDAEQEGARSFDKTIITLASGALGLSITFIDKIVKGPVAKSLWALKS